MKQPHILQCLEGIPHGCGYQRKAKTEHYFGAFENGRRHGLGKPFSSCLPLSTPVEIVQPGSAYSAPPPSMLKLSACEGLEALYWSDFECARSFVMGKTIEFESSLYFREVLQKKQLRKGPIASKLEKGHSSTIRQGSCPYHT